MAKKQHRRVIEGIAHIQATFNNTKISISDPKGNVLAFKSAGSSGFKGSSKGTAYGAELASKELARLVKEKFDMKYVKVKVRGPGSGRYSAICGLRSGGLLATSFEDRTRLPHNGPRPCKERRV